MDNISKKFNKFAGREVKVTETPREIMGTTYIQTDLDPNDPVIKQIEKEAKKSGFSTVRTWLPGHMGTMEVRQNRLNLDIQKEADGKYRIQKDSFRAG